MNIRGTLKILAGIILIALITAGCSKKANYPPEPVIDFQYILVKDTVEQSELANHVVLYEIVFKVFDGDNNLGVPVGDTTADSTARNLFITILNKKNGEFDTVNLPLKLTYTIPQAQVVSIYNYFKAIVLVDLTFDPVVIQNFLDTFKFSFYVVDQDNNISNIQETPELTTQFRGVLGDTTTLIP